MDTQLVTKRSTYCLVTWVIGEPSWSQIPQTFFKHFDIPQRAHFGEHFQRLLVSLPIPFHAPWMAPCQ